MNAATRKERARLTDSYQSIQARLSAPSPYLSRSQRAFMNAEQNRLLERIRAIDEAERKLAA